MKPLFTDCVTLCEYGLVSRRGKGWVGSGSFENKSIRFPKSPCLNSTGWSSFGLSAAVFFPSMFLFIIIMHCKIFLLVLFSLSLLAGSTRPNPHQLSQSAQINNILFNQDYLFYLSRLGNHFGFISRETGETMSKYQLQSHQSIIAIHKETDTVILRSAREKALLFNIASTHLEELMVQIAFKHQQILDVLKINKKVFVLTDKDVRVYDQDEQKKGEGLRHIVSSARKNQYFKKIFLREGQPIEDLIIVLIRNGEVCLRSFKKVKRGTDECYFRTPYEIISIDQVNGNILFQTEIVNYMITKDLFSFYSFKGNVTQFSNEYVLLSDFRTYDTQNQIFLDGLIVQGSDKERIFWIHSNNQHSSTIYFNAIKIGDLTVPQRPRRSWVSAHNKDNNRYQLLVEFQSNRFDMYDIETPNHSAPSFSLKWTTKALEGTSAEQM